LNPEARRENVKFWRARDLGDLELLRASYVTHSFSPHIHEGYAVGVIERGVEVFEYRRATHAAVSGNVVVINPGEVHTGRRGSDEGWTYRMLYPDVALLRDAAGEVAGRFADVPFFPEPVVQDRYLAGLILELHKALEQPASKIERESRLLLAFAQLIGRHADSRPVQKPVGREKLAVRRVRDYLETRYSENVSIKELAAAANLSPFHLIRVFRNETGLPPHAYLNQVRVARAKKLLSSGFSIADTACRTGFADQSHLTKHFKRITGCTPGQYLKDSKNVQY